jgi:uracil phosphoribosyltransferase
VLDHPLIQHKLTLMRKKETSTTSFRRLLTEIGTLMAYEVTREMPMHDVEIETPLETMTSRLIDGKKLVFVPILRAGTGLLDGFLSVVPGARVGHVGLYRDPKTLVAGRVLLQDAVGNARARRDRARPDARDRTFGDRGGRAAEGDAPALDPLRVPGVVSRGDRRVPRRASRRADLHAAVDRQLNDHGYILPGSATRAIRIFGTK